MFSVILKLVSITFLGRKWNAIHDFRCGRHVTYPRLQAPYYVEIVQFNGSFRGFDFQI